MSPLWVKIRFICKFLIIKPKQTSNPYNFCKRASNKTYFGAWEIPSMSESKLLQADSFQNSIIRFQMEASNFSSTQNRSGCVISTKPDAFSRVLIFWNNFFFGVSRSSHKCKYLSWLDLNSSLGRACSANLVHAPHVHSSLMGQRNFFLNFFDSNEGP